MSARWEGKVERDQELLLIIKTKSELVPVVANEIKAKHPYEVPEVISLPIQGGLQGKWTIFSWSPKEMTALEEYLEWIGSSTRNTDESNSSNKA